MIMKSIHFPSPVADEMVRAILEGRKTVTRRVVKPQPFAVKQDENAPCWCGHFVSESGKVLLDKPPYHPGDILYVRETWNCLPIPEPLRGTNRTYWYKADWAEIGDKWRPSIHMPREAARIFLRVTNLRVERLQDITPGQLRAEGLDLLITPSECKSMMNRFGAVFDYERKKKDFSNLWDSTIKKADHALYGWDADPWVWVIEFERISREEAQQCL